MGALGADGRKSEGTGPTRTVGPFEHAFKSNSGNRSKVRQSERSGPMSPACAGGTGYGDNRDCVSPHCLTPLLPIGAFGDLPQEASRRRHPGPRSVPNWSGSPWSAGTSSSAGTAWTHRSGARDRARTATSVAFGAARWHGWTPESPIPRQMGLSGLITISSSERIRARTRLKTGINR